MNFNTACHSTAHATVSCRESNSFSNEKGHTASGCGEYRQKAYDPKVSVVCEYNKCVLRIVEAYNTKYEIFYEGELFNRYSNFSIAETFFIDFAGLTKSKYKKLKNALT